MCPSNGCYIFGQCGMYTSLVWKYEDRLGMHMNLETVLTFPDREVYTHKKQNYDVVYHSVLQYKRRLGMRIKAETVLTFSNRVAHTHKKKQKQMLPAPTL